MSAASGDRKRGSGLNRRHFLRRVATGSAAAGSLLGGAGVAQAADGNDTASALRAAADTDLIYIANERPDGALGRCQAEVWFAPSGGELVVVTDASSWRVKMAQRQGATARIWIGDVGRWQRADGAWRDLPSIRAGVRLDDDPAFAAAALDQFGRKYPASWLLWGPRFRKGLADGSRKLLRFAPLA
jgi:hypothetical protein